MEIALLIVLFGLIFDYTNGFHDAANVVATVIATRVLTPLAAISMACVMNIAGAVHISGVAQTIATGLVNPEDATQLVVLASVIGAILWNILTWYYGIPSSSSYALIGGLIGAATMHSGIETIFWGGLLYKVILPLFIAPTLGFSLGYGVMRLLSRLPQEMRQLKLFRHLQIGSAALVALAHGLNDAQKSMGLITLGLYTSGLIATPAIPFWVIVACAITLGLGTASAGFRIIRTMGFKITDLNPMQGFAAESSSAGVILGASLLGMPVSSTYLIAGGITGVGAARGTRAVRWQVPQLIAGATLCTIPGSALLSALVYLIFGL
jgi:PiT family inorganic phosphate transporter